MDGADSRLRGLRPLARGLQFNLIIDSEAGGKTPGRAFHERTLKMPEASPKAGDRPTRYVVPGPYPFPERVVPETAPYSMTALVKAVIQRLHDPAAAPGGGLTPSAPAGRIRNYSGT